MGVLLSKKNASDDLVKCLMISLCTTKTVESNFQDKKWCEGWSLCYACFAQQTCTHCNGIVGKYDNRVWSDASLNPVLIKHHW